MITIRQIIEGALVELQARGLGQDIGDEEADRGLMLCQAMYREAVEKGVFGRVWEYYASGAYTAIEQQRVYSNGYTITLPTAIQNNSFASSDYGRFYGSDADYGFYGQPTRRPRDLAMIQVVNAGAAPQINIYDAEKAAWVRLDSLELITEAPFADRNRHGLECALARKLSATFQRPVPESTAAYAAGLASVFSNRFSAPATVTNAEFF